MKDWKILFVAGLMLAVTGCGDGESDADESTKATEPVDSSTGSNSAVGSDSSSSSNGDTASAGSGKDATDSDSATASSAAGTGYVLPPGNAPWDYQIGGGYTPSAEVRVVIRDREDTPAEGVYNICYVNGFQIQPNEESWWQTNHPDLILRDGDGVPLVDEDWDEMLLDVRTEQKREALATIVGEWIAQCAADGFDAVEIDNLDSYSRSNGLLSQAQSVLFMRALSDIAHASGLASSQKNSAEFLDKVEQMRTDFAVVEECNRWDECGDYREAYGDLLFIVEYRRQDFESGCSEWPDLSIILRDLDVTTPSDDGYIFDGC